MRAIAALLFGAGCLMAAGAVPSWGPARADSASGVNPHPVKLVRPAAKPLSAMAELGKLIFFDPSLSSSGRMSCASCHSPQHAYGPPNDLPAMMGGPHLTRQGVRAVPSLRYLERQPAFSIGPENEEAENTNLLQQVALSRAAPRVTKTATQTAQAA
ncbi:MAG: cytochrome c peroxidase, partial [Pseudolabrys sp.]